MICNYTIVIRVYTYLTPTYEKCWIVIAKVIFLTYSNPTNFKICIAYATFYIFNKISLSKTESEGQRF